jgi:hypothetical protein
MLEGVEAVDCCFLMEANCSQQPEVCNRVYMGMPGCCAAGVRLLINCVRKPLGLYEPACICYIYVYGKMLRQPSSFVWRASLGSILLMGCAYYAHSVFMLCCMCGIQTRVVCVARCFCMHFERYDCNAMA